MKRALIIATTTAVLVTAVLVSAAWCVSRDEVTALREMERNAPPVPPLVASAIAAAEDPMLFERAEISLRSFQLPSRNMAYCAPSLTVQLVRSVSNRKVRMLRWHLEGAITTFVVSRTFTADALLRIYATHVYLGRVDGQDVYGFEHASRAYYGKSAQQLNAEEAAMLAAMIRHPSYYSPVTHPERAIKRRDLVLQRMRTRFSSSS